MSNTITVVDADGNTYVLAEPVSCGVCSYSVTKTGEVLVVAKLSRDAQRPQFVLAPAVETEDVVQLKAALENARRGIERYTSDPQYTDRYDEGYSDGYDEGYSVGREDGKEEARDE
jgi:flagellar biosynthesis/type III secretory pathway protein FliH